jgi:hypothetical protein
VSSASGARIGDSRLEGLNRVIVAGYIELRDRRDDEVSLDEVERIVI